MTDYKSLLLLASEMLLLAAEEFDNHGCNDLRIEIVKMIPQSMCDDMRQWNSGGSDDYPIKPSQIMNSSLMYYLSSKMKEISKELNRDIKINNIL